MSGFAETVRTGIEDPSCLVDAIDRADCGAALTDAPHPRVIVDLDKTGSPLGAASTKCDFLFFGDPDLVMPIEVKDHGAPDIVKVRKTTSGGRRRRRPAGSGRCRRPLPARACVQGHATRQAE